MASPKDTTIQNVSESPVSPLIKCSAKDSVELTTDGKNMKQIKCRQCPSTILVSDMATLVTNNVNLPAICSKSNDTAENTSENISNQYWCVDNMYTFENVGFSKTVDGVKYLICADCEMGPIGYHDLMTKLSYVCLDRVEHC